MELINKKTVERLLFDMYCSYACEGRDLKKAAILNDAINYVRLLEPEEERLTGKWIKDDMFECDQCHYLMIVGDGAYNYCPECGAKMEK